MAAKGADRKRTERAPKHRTPYLFAGRVVCVLCGRKMSGHRTGTFLGYQCRLRETYALPETDSHPKSVWLPERRLVVATFDWLDEIFAPESRDRVLGQIVSEADHPPSDLASASGELADATRRIARLVDAVENGTFDQAEVDGKLRQLRERQRTAKALLAAAEAPRAKLDPRAISDMLDRLGGLMNLEARLTDEERKAIFSETALRVSWNATTRVAKFSVDLAVGVSECVGGGT
jgi:hypothetical protein